MKSNLWLQFSELLLDITTVMKCLCPQQVFATKLSLVSFLTNAKDNCALAALYINTSTV